MNQDEMRREFEEWISSGSKAAYLDLARNDIDPARNDYGQYWSFSNQLAWEAWQAARKQDEINMPCDEPKLKIQAFYQQGDDPFICGIHGAITQDALAEIEQDMINDTDMFERGDGDYLFTATYQQGQQSFPETGQWDFPPHYELDIIHFKPTPPTQDKP